jgi:hypothetical protein
VVGQPRGPRPGSPIQRGKWHACRRRVRTLGALATWSPRLVHARDGVFAGGTAVPCRRQGVPGEHWGNTGEAPGRVTGTELTEMRLSTGRQLGDGKQMHSVVARGAPVVVDNAEGGSCNTGE